jgi:hypothetical protein
MKSIPLPPLPNRGYKAVGSDKLQVVMFGRCQC